MPAKTFEFAYYHPREIQRRKVERGAAAIRLRKRLARLEAEHRGQPMTQEQSVLYSALVQSMRKAIAEADRKAARIEQRLRATNGTRGTPKKGRNSRGRNVKGC